MFARLLSLVFAVAVMTAQADTATTPTADERRYGGTLDIGTVYYTLSALSWDPIDWSWKINHDTGACA